jgi:hypothetical protein
MTMLREAALAYAAAGYEVFPLRGKLPHANCTQCEPRSRRYRPHRAADCPHELCLRRSTGRPFIRARRRLLPVRCRKWANGAERDASTGLEKVEAQAS